MMVQAHDNDWLYILLCDFQLRTKTFNNHIHVHHIISRNLSHHELTQYKFDCRLVYRLAVAQGLQPCPHLIYRMNMTIENLLLQWFCHFLDILDFGFLEYHITLSYSILSGARLLSFSSRRRGYFFFDESEELSDEFFLTVWLAIIATEDVAPDLD